MSSGHSTDERDPFAPPPDDASGRRWRSRRSGAEQDASSAQGSQDTPQDQAGDSSSGHASGGSGGASGNTPGGSSGGRGGQSGGHGEGSDADGSGPSDAPHGQQPDVPPTPPTPWARPRRTDNQDDEQNNSGGGSRDGSSGSSGPRFDPAERPQRRARYALLSGLWGLFFGFFGITELSLLLGALALYWGVSSLRGSTGEQEKKASASDRIFGDSVAKEGGGDSSSPSGSSEESTRGTSTADAEQEPGQVSLKKRSGYGVSSKDAPRQPRPQATAAWSGLVAGAAALLLVVSTFTVQLVYKDYFDCSSDALTKAAKQSCSKKLPEPLHDLFGVDES